MWPLTCGPSPSVNRPFDSFCSVHALIAVIVGLRGNAIATAVPRPSVVVACAASAITTKGSTLLSSTISAS